MNSDNNNKNLLVQSETFFYIWHANWLKIKSKLNFITGTYQLLAIRILRMELFYSASCYLFTEEKIYSTRTNLMN